MPDKPVAMMAKCPICGRPAQEDTRPFCSQRCADVDLGRWLTGAYRVPSTREEDEDAVPDNGDAHA